jgi:hypothetical protein
MSHRTYRPDELLRRGIQKFSPRAQESEVFPGPVFYIQEQSIAFPVYYICGYAIS